MNHNKLQRVSNLLLEDRKKTGAFDWKAALNVKGSGVDKKVANKLMLGCILQYQMRADLVWKNARRFAEGDLEDPDDLWENIIAIPNWDSEAVFKCYGLHRFFAAHKRVQRIGKDIVEHYQGDARNIWKKQAPDEVLKRLKRMRVGPQISRMIVGALNDIGQISGAGELKADTHIRRVLGRVFNGKMVSVDAAHRIANKMTPDKPSWKLDTPLFFLGQRTCKSSDPKCENCYLREECKYCEVDTRVG